MPTTHTNPAGVAHATFEPPKPRTVCSSTLMEGALRDALSYMDAMAVLRGGEANELRTKIRDVLAFVDFENACTDSARREAEMRHEDRSSTACMVDFLMRREELLAEWPAHPDTDTSDRRASA